MLYQNQVLYGSQVSRSVPANNMLSGVLGCIVVRAAHLTASMRHCVCFIAFQSQNLCSCAFSLQLNGTIPATWPFPSLMTNLSLIYNELTGTIPEELILPSTLTEFLIDANRLVSSWPSLQPLP